MSKHKVTVILLPSDEGRFQVFVPYFPHCTTDGDTVEDALKNAKEALEGLLETPEDIDIEALEYSHSSVVVVSEIEVEVQIGAKAEATA